MSSTKLKYATSTIIRTYGGTTFKSSEVFSDYHWGNEFTIDLAQTASDPLIRVDLGNGRSIQIRPSDILYVENNIREVHLDENGEEISDE